MKSRNLFKILKSKGFKNIELDNIIESKYVLKRSGGSYRQFLFSFYDQNLKEWSLVPDLSVSSVVKFIQNKIKSKTEWFYTGEAYRKQNKNNKNFKYLITDSKGVIYRNSDNLENLLNNTNWKKVQK